MKTFILKILKQLERYFGTDIFYIFREGGWLAADQIIGNAMSVVLAIAFANLLSQETYGTYRYLMSIVSILTVFSLPSMNLALITSVAKGYEGLFIKALRTRVGWSVIGSLASIGVGIYYFVFQHNQTLALALLIIAVFLPFHDSLNISSGFLRGKKLFRLQAIYSVITRLVSAAVLVITLFFTKNLFIILLAFFIPFFIVRLFVLLRIMKKFSMNEKEDPGVISYGRHLSGIQLMNVLVNSLDNLLIFNFLGPVALAVYNIALLPINKVQQFTSILSELALPKFSGGSSEVIRKTLMKKILKASIFVVVGIVGYVLAVPIAFGIVFPKYGASIKYSLMLSTILVSLPFSFIYTFFQSQAMKKKIAFYNFSVRIAQIILVVALVPAYGIIGAVWARIALQAVSIATLLYLFFKKQPNTTSPA